MIDTEQSSPELLIAEKGRMNIIGDEAFISEEEMPAEWLSQTFEVAEERGREGEFASTLKGERNTRSHARKK